MNSVTFTKALVGIQDDLLRFAYKLTADREDANDLLQETSLKALDNEDKYTPETNFKGWVYTIMRNIFINNYRKMMRDQTFVDQTENQYHLNTPSESYVESTETAYDLKEMHRIVNALPKEYRVPFSMHVAGFKYREIAEKLDLPLGTVKSRIFFTQEPHLLHAPAAATRTEGLRLILPNLYIYERTSVSREKRLCIFLVVQRKRAGFASKSALFFRSAGGKSRLSGQKPWSMGRKSRFSSRQPR